MIVFEVGARSLMEPSVDLQVRSIIEDMLPQINTDVVQVKATTAAPQKTFLEKAFLLHELFSVEHETLPANRRSRHLYDRDRICLVPPEKHIDDWKNDYQYMCDSMIYGEKPTFDELIDSMRELERRFRER